MQKVGSRSVFRRTTQIINHERHEGSQGLSGFPSCTFVSFVVQASSRSSGTRLVPESADPAGATGPGKNLITKNNAFETQVSFSSRCIRERGGFRRRYRQERAAAQPAAL